MSQFTKGFQVVVIACILVVSAMCGQSNAQFSLQVLHSSDLEGGADAIDRAPNYAAIIDALEEEVPNTVILSAGDNYIPGPFFGAASDSTLDGPLADALGLPEADARSGRVDIGIMNIIEFDATCWGNHDFDPSNDTVADAIGVELDGDNQVEWPGVQFPYLSANLDFSGDSSLAGLFTDQILPTSAYRAMDINDPMQVDTPKIAESAFVEVGGEQIGIIGGTTPILASISSPGGVIVENPGAGTNDMAAFASILQPQIDAHLALGLNKIIVVTHLQQIALEKELAGLLSGVDIIIAGGSDTLQADVTDVLRPGDTAVEDYPFLTTNADGEPVAIVSTDGEYSYVGRLVVDFDMNGVLIPASIDPNVSGAFATLPEVVTSVWGEDDPFAEGTKGQRVSILTSAVDGIVTAKDGNVFGRTEVFMNGEREDVRTQETNLGWLTAFANLFVTRMTDPDVQASIKNGGGIRASVGTVEEIAPGVYVPTVNEANPEIGKPEGAVTELDLENTMRFNNGLTTLDLTAAELKEVMEHGYAATEPGATPGQFPQVAGMRVSFDPTMEPGSRIETLALVDENTGDITDVIVLNGILVGDPNRVIRIVTLGFLADGGDDYPFPELAENIVDTGIGEQSALGDLLTAMFPSETNAFIEPETEPGFDRRTQNLNYRALDTVLFPGVEVFRLVNDVTGQQTIVIDPFTVRAFLDANPEWRIETQPFAGIPGDEMAPKSNALYRFLNTNNGLYFYTAFDEERQIVEDNLPQYVLEGSTIRVFQEQITGTVPVYRVFDSALEMHIYTTSKAMAEMYDAMENRTLDGAVFYAYP